MKLCNKKHEREGGGEERESFLHPPSVHRHLRATLKIISRRSSLFRQLAVKISVSPSHAYLLCSTFQFSRSSVASVLFLCETVGHVTVIFAKLIADLKIGSCSPPMCHLLTRNKMVQQFRH